MKFPFNENWMDGWLHNQMFSWRLMSIGRPVYSPKLICFLHIILQIHYKNIGEISVFFAHQ